MLGARVILGMLMTFGGVVFSSTPSWAVDPFTVLAAGNAAVNLIDMAKGGGKDAGDLRGVFSALGELNDELLPEGSSDDPYRIARKIEAIEHAALEAGYTKEEVETLVSGYRSSNQNLAGAVRLLTHSIKLGKRLAGLAAIGGVTGPGGAGIGAAAGSVGGMQGQAQEKKILADIYGQMVSSSLDQKREQIEQKKAVQEQYKKLKKFAFSVAPQGNLSLFPINNDLVQKAVRVYKDYYWILLSLVGAIFLGRVALYQFSLSPPEKYVELIQDVFVCYFLMAAFPYVYTVMAEASEALSLKLGQILHVTGMTIPDSIPIDKTDWFWWCRWEVFPLLIYAATYVVFNFAISVLVALGPIVVLIGTMLGFSSSLSAYFALLLFVWLWPSFWNVLGYFKNIVWSDSGIGSTVGAFFLFLFQMLSPLAIYSMLKGTHGGQVAHQFTGAAAKKVAALGRASAIGGSGGGVGDGPRAGGGGGGVGDGPSSSGAGVGAGSKLFIARRSRQASGFQLGKERFEV